MLINKFILVCLLLCCSDNCAFAENYYCSQNGQDRFINEKIFKNKRGGVFVEVGAHDGVTYSNTYFFERYLGWSGFCIEPLPDVFEKLTKNRKCRCLNSCIANFSGQAKFLMVSGYAQMLSGLINSYDPLHVARIEKEIHDHGGDSKIIDVPCYRLEDILREHKVFHVDYLSVDTEGSEFEVLQSIDFKETNIDLISVENNYKDDKIARFLKQHNYFKIASIGGDDIYKKSDK